ncbi:bifunctional riboflavin kinase/FAD synthetase [Ignatzschineria rhizosphaerae]|uniref:Riboflavin biosynthesis protein n=1 Tax=Ignatzschineria rhizosphaerae TaxID=2923279 RepID=A0ABY3WXE6_9GAMM|nr:bifunctional riboflavin kinase/FAD synthetase [Ignatzschineria rhizosphaerae]UNM95279.1 bifunctional riboflavin kinase/FAD synthetase [Ignatzschineria rhizosphaerae]
MNFFFYRDSCNIPREPRVLTIGAFDGIHLGHQKLLHQLNELQKKYPGTKRTLVTFEPLPHEFFLNEDAPGRVMSLKEKLIFLRSRNLVDEVIILPFTAMLRDQSPESFINDFLVKDLSVKAIVVGDDFRFGAKAAGSFNDLLAASEKFNFEVIKEDYYYIGGVRVSSTLVREALASANFNQAALYLGRSYEIISRVVYGNQLARQLGTATINLPIKRFKPLFTGVYNVEARLCSTDEILNGVANIGYRPTVNGVKPNLEVHLHDVNRNLYGETFSVKFLSKIRDEQRFENIEALKKQILADAKASKDYFNLQK